MFISMTILHFIPGGKTAGQVPLEYALENYMKDQKMAGVDNEHELEELGRSGEDRDRSSSSKKDTENDVVIEMAVLESKKKYDENDDTMFMEQEVLDDDAFLVPPRFDSFSRSSNRTLRSTLSDGEHKPDGKHISETKVDNQSSDEDMAI